MTKRTNTPSSPSDVERTGEAENAQVAGEAAGDTRESDPITALDPPVPAEAVTPAVDPPVGETVVEEPLTDHELILQNLTEEEGTALLLAAAKAKMASRTAAEQAVIDALADTDARKARQAAPLDFVGLDIGKNNAYVYVKLDHPPIAPERTVRLHGTTFEHVDTDLDGVWLYRHLG